MKNLPEEPTREMWAAMGDALLKVHTDHNRELQINHDLINEAIYRAAYEAAPKPKPKDQGWSGDGSRHSCVP